MRSLLVATLLLLAACGFQLQGRQVLPARLATLELAPADRHSDFTRALRDALRGSRARLVEKAPADGVVVRVLRDVVTERVLSVDARNIPTDFELVYEVDVEVLEKGQVLMPAEPFSLSRIYSFDETRLLAKEREKDLLREALARDMASVVMRRLASL